MPRLRLTQQDVQRLTIQEAQQLLTNPGNVDVNPQQLYDRKQQIIRGLTGESDKATKQTNAKPEQQNEQKQQLIRGLTGQSDEATEQTNAKPKQQEPEVQIGKIADNTRSVAAESEPDSVREQWNAFDRKRLKAEQRERGQEIFQSQGIEFRSPRPEAPKQVGGLVFVDQQPEEDLPLTYRSHGGRVARFSAAEQSAQIAYDKRVQQKKQRKEEAWLDGVRQSILNLGQ